MTTIVAPNNIDEKLLSNKEIIKSSKSPSPSPRNSPAAETRQEHLNIDQNNSSYSKDGSSNNSSNNSKQDTGSLSSSQESTTDLFVLQQNDSIIKSDNNNGLVIIKDKKERLTRKKFSWFNSLYPTYKSRSEDFKKLFQLVPSDERLIVDYSCALQKEILVHGRLYVTQKYLCFYANIFGWETNLTLKWKDVAAITKEKTALVIPNAVLIYTKEEKYFFTSLVQRDKTYLMLFRIWQNSLMDQPMSQQEMWTWVHQCYGAELGLTSDDEDYISPSVVLIQAAEEEKLSSSNSFSELENSSPRLVGPLIVMDEIIGEQLIEQNTTTNRTSSQFIDLNLHQHQVPIINAQTYSDNMNTDNDSESSDKPISMKDDSNIIIDCTAIHEGRVLIDEVYPIHIDQLFTLLFTSSKFYLDFHASRKTSNLTQTPWTHNPVESSRSRVVNLTVSLGQTMGPKTCQVTERQTMLPCCKPGSLYSVDVETVNAGVPYADSFYLVVHYCLKKIDKTHSSIYVTASIKYKKELWGLVRNMIERNVFSGLDDFFSKLKEALQSESEENIPEKRRKSRQNKRRLHSLPRDSLEDIRLNNTSIPTSRKMKSSSQTFFTTDICTIIVLIVLIILLVLNVMLYYRLWSLEDASQENSSSAVHHNSLKLMNLGNFKNSPKTHEEWIDLLQQQEAMRSVEAQKWQSTLMHVVKLLKEAEEALEKLQKSIQPDYMSKIVEAMGDLDISSINNNNNNKEL